MSIQSTDKHHLTKIVATLGPASDSLQVITKLAEAGSDLFRLNFSHGTHEQHEQTLKNIRVVEKVVDRPIGIIADLQGPKLRVKDLPYEGVRLVEGETFELRLEGGDGDSSGGVLPHPEIFAVAKPDTELLLDDGNLRLKITEVSDGLIKSEVVVGGILKPNKGVNYPGVSLPIAALTAKDKIDLQFALDLEVDWVALSFVQYKEDLIEAQELIAKRARLIAKIEKPLAVENFSTLLDHCEGIMVARGDLGVETSLENVPALQKRMIRQSRARGRPVIVATQMLESMTHNATPTRAEASDVATALYDGTDAVMLSAESASGSHPVKAVEYMRRIICSTEKDPEYQVALHRETMGLEKIAPAAIVAAACTVADVVKAVAIVSFSKTGNTTLRASRQRPNCHLLGLTPLISTARAATLFWGVHSILTPDLTSDDDMVVKASKLATQYGFALDGDSIIVTAGIPLGIPGGTNVLHLAVIGERT